MVEPAPLLEDLIKEAKSLYSSEFKEDAQVVVFAPGRVNLIGEHTDYNEGFVLPVALPLVTVIVGNKINGTKSTIITGSKDVDDPKLVTIDITKNVATSEKIPKWSNYVLGVIANYLGTAFAIEAAIVSSVPVGGGLSSSAAVEVATYMFLEAVNPCCTVAPIDKALACQKAEHDYAGMPCGIMDQFISVMGKKDTALLIDCQNMTSQLIPLVTPDKVILIVNSNVKHELTGSEYPTRRKQCFEGAALLQKKSLREANISDIEQLKTLTDDELIIKRARHVISEIERTTSASEALKSQDYQRFGQLMIESHSSLRDDYEVSCPEVDQLVEIALSTEGVLGSRMTGGGFGGCTVSLVYSNAVDNVVQRILENYQGKPTFYICTPSDGAKIISSPFM